MEIVHKAMNWIEALSPEVLIGVLVGIVLALMITGSDRGMK